MTTAYHDSSPRSLRIRIALTELRDKVRRHSRDMPPVPPARFRHHVHGSPGYSSFLRAGERVSDELNGLLQQVGVAIGDGQRILDFGCGCARVLRYLHGAAPHAEWLGTDCDERAIAWCSAHLSGVSFQTNDLLPPLSYEDNHFDFVYSISVFTHLDENAQWAWLEELRRITRPGGTVILTVHGDTAHTVLEPGQRAALASKGFLCLTGRHDSETVARGPQIYPRTHHTRTYIEREWSRYFDVVRIAERGINGHQDAIVLRKANEA